MEEGARHARGRGGGGAVCGYLVDAECQGREHCAPEVVRGDLARTQELIDSIGRQWTYTHGVLSFAPEDAPSVAEQAAAMDAYGCAKSRIKKQLRRLAQL